MKNAGAINKESISVPFSNFKLAIAEKLKETGYVTSIEKRGKKVKKTLEIVLKYNEDGAHAIAGVKRISKPGRRMYKSVHEIHNVRYGAGSLMLSTPQGIKTDKEARKDRLFEHYMTCHY